MQICANLCWEIFCMEASEDAMTVSFNIHIASVQSKQYMIDLSISTLVHQTLHLQNVLQSAVMVALPGYFAFPLFLRIANWFAGDYVCSPLLVSQQKQHLRAKAIGLAVKRKKKWETVTDEQYKRKLSYSDKWQYSVNGCLRYRNWPFVHHRGVVLVAQTYGPRMKKNTSTLCCYIDSAMDCNSVDNKLFETKNLISVVNYFLLG